jgi:hypothetical protein
LEELKLTLPAEKVTELGSSGIVVWQDLWQALKGGNQIVVGELGLMFKLSVVGPESFFDGQGSSKKQSADGIPRAESADKVLQKVFAPSADFISEESRHLEHIFC